MIPRIRSLPPSCSANAPVLPVTNRRIGGRKAKRSGDALERAIMFGAGQSGIVRLTKLPACGGRFIGKGRFVNEAMPCDFVGTVIGTGQGIYFDAKCVGEERASLRVNDPLIVKKHQIAFLRAMHDAGAISGLLVQSNRVAGYLWLSAGYLGGDEAVAWTDTRWIRLGDTTRFVDFGKLVEAIGESK
jgi:hypothetical protein